MKRVIYMLVLFACGGDPVRDRAEEGLGPEAPGESPGPSHRAGQPCTTCHRVDGPARAFVVGGTIYVSPTDKRGAAGIIVVFDDRNGSKRQVMTNDVGNFFIASQDWSPAFPIGVALYDGDTPIGIKTRIAREGSCAKCHSDPRGPTSAGALYASELARSPLR